jgi:hypothetical protein
LIDVFINDGGWEFLQMTEKKNSNFFSPLKKIKVLRPVYMCDKKGQILQSECDLKYEFRLEVTIVTMILLANGDISHSK